MAPLSMALIPVVTDGKSAPTEFYILDLFTVLSQAGIRATNQQIHQSELNFITFPPCLVKVPFVATC